MLKFDVWSRHATRALFGALLATALAACGGGGSGNAGTPVVGPGSGASSPTGAQAAYAMAVQVQRSGAAVTQISSVETVQAVATVTTKAGDPVSGVVVTFSETSVGLLAFQPKVATALTGADGKASVDLGAKSNTDTGATTVVASATVAGVSVTANQSIAVTAGSTATPTPATIAFVSSSAGGQAIAIKGAGGNGRAEAAILVFKVLDATGTPINGAPINFSINLQQAAGAIITPASAVSDASGRVTTTVLSGTAPGSVVVVATAAAVSSVKVQSDTLLVSNSVPTQQGFEIVAEKYNLDGDFTGDSTKISAFVRDQFGNPVPDGVAVSFQTDYGAVATSTLGGCTTLNGTCSVDFRVQNPRGTGVATTVASIGVGTSNLLQQSLQIHMAGGTYSVLQESVNALLTSVTLQGTCKQTFQARLQDVQGRAAAAGTVISVDLTSSNLNATIKSGSPVLDQLASDFAPTVFGFEVDATSLPACSATGGNWGQAFVNIGWTSPHGVKASQRIDIRYPTP